MRLEADDYAKKLEEIAADCLDDASIIEPRRFYVERVNNRTRPDAANAKIKREFYGPWIAVHCAEIFDGGQLLEI